MNLSGPLVTPWLAFIESNTSGTGRLFARAAKEEGLRPVILTADRSRYRYIAEDDVDFLHLDTQDLNAMREACRSLESTEGLAGVTTSSDHFIAAAAAVAASLGLPGPELHAVEDCRDKELQISRLRSAGHRLPVSFACDSVEEGLTAGKRIGFPVIVKPVSGSGSVGVKLCSDPVQLALHARFLLGQRQNERGLPVRPRILIQSLVRGTEYSVESFCRTIVGITRKHLGNEPAFVEVGHDYPAQIPPPLIETIEESVHSALDALGLGWGPAHTELRVTEEGPALIEVNPRLAGGFIPELVRLSSGVDLIRETIRLVTGRETDLSARLSRCSSIRFILHDREGGLAGAIGIDEARQVPGITDVNLYVKPGDRLVRRGDFRDRLGHVIACADTVENAQRAVRTGQSLIRLRVGPE